MGGKRRVAEIAGSVSRRLNLLVVGDEPGSKREKAQALGIRIVDEAGFLALLQADNEVTASSSETRHRILNKERGWGK